MTIPLIPADYMERFDSIFTLQDKEGHSTEKRMVILEDSWEIFKEHPLGVGVAAFPKVRMDRFGRNQDTHNLYLEIATNLGFQGFIVVSLFIYKMLATLNNIRASAQMNIIKLLNNGNHRNDILINDLNFVKSLSLATISFIIIRLTLGLFGMDLYEIYWWFAVGISFSLYSIMDNLQKAINDHQYCLEPNKDD
jgi:O-antigen ligase